MRYGHYPPPAAGRNLLAELADAREVNDRLSAVNRLLDRAVLTLQHQLTETLLPRELRCGHCRRYLPLGAFSFDRARKSGRRGWCRECDAIERLRRMAA